jgi:hypothetical protein
MPRDPYAIDFSLKRWCLKTLHKSCDSMLFNALYRKQEERPPLHSRHQGLPPVQFSCIAPHCEEWSPEDTKNGTCAYQKRFMSLRRSSPMSEAPSEVNNRRITTHSHPSRQATVMQKDSLEPDCNHTHATK